MSLQVQLERPWRDKRDVRVFVHDLDQAYGVHRRLRPELDDDQPAFECATKTASRHRAERFATIYGGDFLQSGIVKPFVKVPGTETVYDDGRYAVFRLT